MTLTWAKENSPRWDTDKQRVFGPAELAAVGLAGPAPSSWSAWKARRPRGA
jgi:hypothetical protein